VGRAYRTCAPSSSLWRQSFAQEGNRGAQQIRRHEAEDIEAKRALLRQGEPQGRAVISGVSGLGVQPLLHELMKLVDKQRAPEKESRMTPVEEARRLVVKIGSSILVDEARGEIRRDWLDAPATTWPACTKAAAKCAGLLRRHPARPHAI